MWWSEFNSIKEALDISDSTFAAIMKSNDLDPWTIFNEEGSIKKEVKDEAIYRINMCSEATRESIPFLLKQTNAGEATEEKIFAAIYDSAVAVLKKVLLK